MPSMANLEADSPKPEYIQLFELYCEHHPGHRWLGPVHASARLLSQEPIKVVDGLQVTKLAHVGVDFLSETFDTKERLIFHKNKKTGNPEFIRLPAHLVIIPPEVELFLSHRRNEILAKENEELRKEEARKNLRNMLLVTTAAILNLCSSCQIITMFFHDNDAPPAAVKPKDPGLPKNLPAHDGQKTEQIPPDIKKAIDALQKPKADTGPHDKLIDP